MSTVRELEGTPPSRWALRTRAIRWTGRFHMERERENTVEEKGIKRVRIGGRKLVVWEIKTSGEA